MKDYIAYRGMVIEKWWHDWHWSDEYGSHGHGTIEQCKRQIDEFLEVVDAQITEV